MVWWQESLSDNSERQAFAIHCRSTRFCTNQNNTIYGNCPYYCQTNCLTKPHSMGENSADDCTYFWWSVKKINGGVSTILPGKKGDYNLLSCTGTLPSLENTNNLTG